MARVSLCPDLANRGASLGCFGERPARLPTCHNPERAAVYSVGFLREVSDLSPHPHRPFPYGSSQGTGHTGEYSQLIRRAICAGSHADNDGENTWLSDSPNNSPIFPFAPRMPKTP